MSEPDLRSEHQKRISEAMKLWWRKRRREGWAQNGRKCPSCGVHRIPPGQDQCEGCEAYEEHQL